MAKSESIIPKHYSENAVKVSNSSVKCPKCESYNTTIKSTSTGGSKMICNVCFHKVKSVGFKLIGVLIATILIVYIANAI